MLINQLLEKVTYSLVKRGTATEINGISVDNRKVSVGDAFVCIKGARFDTHNCIEDISKAAALIVVSSEYASQNDLSSLSERVTVISAEDTRLAKAQLAAAWYGNPAEKMVTIGITGSKGKTTTTHMLADCLMAAGKKVVTIGTNGFILDGQITELANTTPDSEAMQMYLAKAVEAGCTHAVIECSSQGLMQHRCSGFTFDYGIFTNIAEGDHIGPNEHKSFEDYLYCKSILIRNSKLGIVYAGDSHISELLDGVETPVVYYGVDGLECYAKPSYVANNIEKTFTDGNPGLSFKTSGELTADFCINLPGDFNVTNALAAIVVCHKEGITAEQMNEALTSLSIKGRIDMVYRDEDISICVDFAHNGYSTRNLLTALREYRPKRLVCVFGADGNRSKSRRYEMGEASGNLADFSYITSGHNRYETFDAILEDIMVGINKTKAKKLGNYVAIKDRKEAIRTAITNAEKGDLITILGLGHESYQEENGVKTPYSDTEYSLEVLRSIGK